MGHFLGWPGTKHRLKCLDHGHNTVPPGRLEPVTSQSQIKHSTTEPLNSSPAWNPLKFPFLLYHFCALWSWYICMLWHSFSNAIVNQTQFYSFRAHKTGHGSTSPNNFQWVWHLSLTPTSLSSVFYRLLMITFANSLGPDQDRQNIGPDLDPNPVTL